MPGVIPASPTDEQLVDRIRAGERELYELLIRRYNQRLYRVIRSVLRADESEIEDVMQQAYVNAFFHLDQFERRASFATWLTRIAVYEALARARRAGKTIQFDADDTHEEDAVSAIPTGGPDPERRAFAGELRELLEEAVERLPDTYRPVFMLREVEGLSTAETAESLGVRPEAVKTRLSRAKAMLREHLVERIGTAGAEAFTFHASRCDRIVSRVLDVIERQ